MTDIIELERKIKDLHDKLSSKSTPCYDREAAEDWGKFKPEHKGNPDYHFMLNLCYGPWRTERQSTVWKNVYSKFEGLGGDITKINKNSNDHLGLPLKWQFDRVLKLSTYLNNNAMTFSQLLDGWRSLSGLEIRDRLKEITDANTTKIFSTFIRDFLGKTDIFPIDRRVESMLNKFGLPNNEDLMVLLCQKAGIIPCNLERMFYEFPESYCEKKNFNECPIKDECYCFILKGDCCKI